MKLTLLIVAIIWGPFLYGTPNISILKRASSDAQPTSGDKINFRIVIENTGDTPLHDIILNDSFSNINNFALSDLDVGDRIVLDKNDIKTLSHIITKENVLDGLIKTQASVAALTSDDTRVSDVSDRSSYNKDDYTIVKIYTENPNHAKVGLLKTTESIKKDYIYYKYTIKNTGKYPLYDIYLSDSSLNLNSVYFPNIAVGKSITYTYRNNIKLKYKLTKKDIAAGRVVSQAKVVAISYGANTETWLGDFSDGNSFDSNNKTIVSLFIKSKFSFLPAIYNLILF